MDVDQVLMESLAPQQRLKLCKQLRQEQIKKYHEWQQHGPEPPKKPVKDKVDKTKKKKRRPRNVRFKNRDVIYDAVARFDDREVLQLLKAGESPDTSMDTGVSLLHKCCADDNVSMTELLLTQKANVNKADDDLWTPLHVAASLDHSEIVQLLLQNHADPTMQNHDGHFPIDLTTEGSESNTIIRDHLSKIGLGPRKLCEIWLQASEQMMQDVAAHLNEKRDINATSENGVTLLHIACANGYGKVTSLLLRSKAAVDLQDSYCWTPLHVAAKFGQEKQAKLLLKHGANPLIEDCLGRKASQVATVDDLIRDLQAAERAWAEEARKNPHRERRVSIVINRGFERSGSVPVSSKIIRPPHISLSKRDELFENEKWTEEVPEDEEHSEDEEDYDDTCLSWHVGTETDVAKKMDHLPEPVKNDDLINLPEISTEILINELKTRYEADRIYTYVGDILLALNPFKPVPYYSKQISSQYTNVENCSSLMPHIFNIAQKAYKSLVTDAKPQCCVISGESGAGKTESCKHFIQHLLMMSKSEECHLNGKIQKMNPLLEAFGNAQTVMNDNSSRFGKFIEVVFTEEGLVQGAKITEYLLEKSRVVQHGARERNYHIFYLMFAGLSPDERTAFGLREAKDHRYLRSNDLNEDISKHLGPEMGQKFSELRDVLRFVGFTNEEVRNIFSLLSASLLLGDLNFKPTGSNDAAQIINMDILRKIASLLDVPPDELSAALVSEVSITRGESIKKERTLAQASDCRDGLAKALYSRLFSWIVNGINNLLQPPEDCGQCLEIGVLDIFGFENFQRNSFEQLCINLANEQLQHYFNEHIFQMELEDCKKERVTLLDGGLVQFTNNQPTIDLFLEKPMGLLSILDEESRFPKANEKTLATKLHSNLSGCSIYTAPKNGGPSFTINHYAGPIIYDVKGMLDKNRDTLPNSIMFTLKTSNSLLIRELFQSKVTRTGTLAPSKRQQKSRVVRISNKKMMKSKKGAESKTKSAFDFFRRKKGSGEKKKQDPRSVIPVEKKGPSSVAFHFRNSLNDLMTKVSSSAPHFVRCIKTNLRKSPNVFIRDYVELQLKYTGVGETVRIRQQGYPFRPTFEEFFERYPVIKMCYSPKLTEGQSVYYICNHTLRNLKLSDYKVGKTKVFFQLKHIEQLETISKGLECSIVLIQKVFRGYSARKRFAGILETKRRQESYILAFLLDVERHLTTSFELLSEQCGHDRQRHDDMIQRELKEECQLQAMEDGKRNEEINKSIDELDKLISEAETLLENYTSGRVSLSSTSSEGDLVENGNEHVRESLDHLDDVLEGYDDGSPLGDDPFANDILPIANGELSGASSTRNSDVIAESSDTSTRTSDVIAGSSDVIAGSSDVNTESGDFLPESSDVNTESGDFLAESSDVSSIVTVIGATLETETENPQILPGATESETDEATVAPPSDTNFGATLRDKRTLPKQGDDEVFLHGYITPKEGSIRTKKPPPSPAEAADVVADIFPGARQSLPPPPGPEEMLPPPPGMEEFPPPPPDTDDNLPLPPPPENDWEMGPENGYPRRRSQPQTLTIQGGKRPPAPPKRSPSTRLSSASLSDAPSSPNSQNSRPSSRQLDKYDSPSPDSTIDSRSHSRSSSGSYDRQSVGSTGERHSITQLYDAPNASLRNSIALQRSMSQNTHDRTTPSSFGGHPHYQDTMDMDRRRGSYPKTGVPPPPRYTNGSNTSSSNTSTSNLYEEINDFNSYQRHIMEKNDVQHQRSQSVTDPDLAMMRNKHRPPPLQTQEGRPPLYSHTTTNGRSPQQKFQAEANMSPPPSFTPPPPPNKKSPKTPQSPVLSSYRPQSPRMARFNEQQEPYSPTYGRRNSSPATSMRQRVGSGGVLPESPPPPVPDNQQPVRSFTPPSDGPVVQSNIKPSMLKSPAHSQFMNNAQRRMSPPSTQNNTHNTHKTPPPPAAKPEMASPPILESQHNVKPSMFRSSTAPENPNAGIETQSLVRPSMFRNTSQSSPPPPPAPIESYRSSGQPENYRSPPPKPEPKYHTQAPEPMYQTIPTYTASEPQHQQSITHERLVRPSAFRGGAPAPAPAPAPHPAPHMHPTRHTPPTRPMEPLPPSAPAPAPPPPPPVCSVPPPPVPPPPMMREPAPHQKHKVMKPVQPPVAPKNVMPPGTSGSDLLLGIAAVKLKKREKKEEKERLPKTPDDQHNAMLAQIRDGPRLRRGTGGFIPEIHGDTVDTADPLPPVAQSYYPVSTTPYLVPTSHEHMNNCIPDDSVDEDDLPLPPPPIDAAFEEESRQYQEFLKREEGRSVLKGGGYNKKMPSSKSGPQENATSELDVTQLPGYQRIPDNCPVWKRPLMEKKNKEIVDKYLEEKAVQDQEAAKWKNIPEWKKKIIERKEQEKKVMQAPVEQEKKIKEQEMEKLASMPEWKREIFLRKKMDSGDSS
ncbi:unconventional myosin-XVI-like isoform X2 [Lineus longissimus]|uniref:unconventional myosin-XVI-like isoform X2 n=1 Tax=Lineus longissimus TaxID=88925 RepID=UPI00315CA0A3